MFGILGDDIGSNNMVDELDYENMQLKFLPFDQLLHYGWSTEIWLQVFHKSDISLRPPLSLPIPKSCFPKILNSCFANILGQFSLVSDLPNEHVELSEIILTYIR